MKWIKFRTAGSIALTTTAVFTSILLISDTTFAGISTELPNPSDMEAGDKPGRLDLHLKNLDVAQVVKNKMAAYYPSSDTSANGKSIKITIGNEGKNCDIDEAKVSGNIKIVIAISGGVNATYTIPIDKVCDTGQFYGNTFSFPNGTLINDPGSPKNRADITVSYNATKLPANNGSDLNYRMLLTGNNKDNKEDSGKLALTRNDNAQEFGLRSAYDDNPSAAPNAHVKASVPFGYPCSENVGIPATRQVKVYDADSVFGDSYMWVERKGQKLERSDYDEGDFRLIQRWDSAGKRWKLSQSNNTYNMVTIAQNAIVRGDAYELVVFNPGTNVDGIASPYNAFSPHYNTLSVGIPEDSIYANGDCEYELRPSITNVSPDMYAYYPNLTVNAVINKTGTGPVPESHPWQIYAVRFAGEPPTRNLRNDYTNDNPCGATVMPAGATGCGKVKDLSYAAQPSDTINPYTGGGPDNVGTRLCFFARIQNPRHFTDDDNLWSYSDLDCSISAKQPKVHVLGSDLKVRGAISTSATSTRATDGTTKTFGSWVEYGVFSTSSNVVASSGAGLKNGNPSSSRADWSKLTFANRLTQPTDAYGNYSPLSLSTAMNWFGNLSETSTTYTAPDTGVYRVGDLPLNSTNMPTVPKGRSVIIQSSGTVTINNDINVDGAGLNRIQDISQVVIVAKDIVIAGGVGNVDAWLLASNSINTCSDVNLALPLTSSQCTNPLIVNGAVTTPNLYLRRTAGADAANPQTAAETFRLRPDAQLWAYNYANKGDRAQTVYVTELPPRF